jgi:amino acid transporter
MKNVKKSMPIAIMLAITVVAVYYIMLTVIVTRAFGQPFLDNWSSLASTGSAPISGIGGFVPFFALLYYKNVPLYVVMFLALWVPEIFSLPPLLISQTRYVFAWSFDRILPDKMASVSERTHTPIIASVAVAIGGIIGAMAMAFLRNSGEFATLSFAMFSFGFIIPAIAAIVFPFRKKQIYETAFIAKKKFILPLISWLGLGSGVYLVYSTILSYQSGSLPIDSFSWSMFGIIYGLAVVIYVVAYVRNLRRGLPLGLVFKEIPPE